MILDGNPLIRVIQSKLASEVHVMCPIVQHILRISDSTGNSHCYFDVCSFDLPYTRPKQLQNLEPHQ